MKTLAGALVVLALGLGSARPAGAAPAAASPPVVPVAAARIAQVPNAHCSNPRPSPDARFVAYVVDELKDVRRQMVYVRDSKTSRRLQPVMEMSAVRRKLASGGAAAGQVCHELSWLPGTPVGAVMSCNNGEGNYDLFFIEPSPNLDKPAYRITRHEANDFHPTGAGRGGSMAVIYVSGRSGDGDLYGLDLPVGAELDDRARRLTSVAEMPELSPIFSPAGDAFVFVRQTARGEDDLYRMPLAGGEATALSRLPGSELNPGFSRDGRQLAFYGNARDRKQFDLYVRPVDGGEPVSVASGTVRPEQGPAAFTPDGTGLVYVRHEDPLNPIEIVYPGEPNLVVRLDTQTLQNKDPSLVALPDGRWYLTFTAQANLEDRQKRWDQIYAATVDPAALRAAAAPAAAGRKKTPARK